LHKEDIINELLETGEWQGMKDARRIASAVKKEAETVVVADDVELEIDYLDQINTEIGKERFWAIRNMVNLSPHELSVLIVKYLNLKYKLVVDPATGEVTYE
jgi:hypothetical protein